MSISSERFGNAVMDAVNRGYQVSFGDSFHAAGKRMCNVMGHGFSAPACVFNRLGHSGDAGKELDRVARHIESVIEGFEETRANGIEEPSCANGNFAAGDGDE